MAQLTTAEAKRINRQNRSSYETGLGDRVRELEGGSIATGTEGQVPICDASGVPTPKTLSGDISNTADGVVTVGNDKIIEPKLKVVNRDLTIAAEATSATVTNAADIDGFLGQAHFTAASADATANEIVSVRFVPSTGALTVTVNVAATAETVVRVPIIQAA